MEKNRVSVRMHRPSINELMFFLLSGAIVSVPLTLFIQQYLAGPILTGLPSVDISVISVAVVAPFVEEFSKVFPLGYRHGETQRSIFLLAICVGLGFGIVEFTTYVATYGPQLIPARIPGLFFHPASTSIIAYGLSTKRPLQFYLVAVGLHFVNNFFAVFAPLIAPISVIVLAVTLFTSWHLYNRTKEVFIQNNNICSC